MTFFRKTCLSRRLMCLFCVLPTAISGCSEPPEPYNSVEDVTQTDIEQYNAMVEESQRAIQQSLQAQQDWSEGQALKQNEASESDTAETSRLNTQPD